MRLLCLSIFLVSVFSTLAQTPYFRKHSLPYDLNPASINVMVQDVNGYVWFGTTHGLLKYDGISFEEFDQDSARQINVTALHGKSSGDLWVGLHNGTIRKVRKYRFLKDTFSLKGDAQVTSIESLSRNRLVVSTYGSGVYILDDSTGRLQHTNASVGDGFIYDMSVDQDGNAYMGTDDGLFVMSTRGPGYTVAQYASDHGLQDEIVTAVVCDNDNVWIGTESEGVALFDTGSKRFYQIGEQWQYGRVTSILPCKDVIWVGTANHGVVVLHKRGRYAYQVGAEEPSMPLRVTGLLRDREGNAWVSGTGSTIISASPQFSLLGSGRNNTLGNIQALVHDHNDNLIFSTNAGLFTARPHVKFQPQRLDYPQLEGVQVISLFQDSLNGLWMGTFDKGVFYRPAGATKILQFSEEDGLINNNVLSIAGKGNEIWFATLGGVSRARLEAGHLQFENFTSENGIGSNYIYNIFIDSKGRIWFATDGEGVSVLSGGKFQNFLLDDKTRSDVVYSVAEDVHGQIWINTAGSGLYVFRENTFHRFVPSNGLRNLNITSIVGDSEGNILLVTANGIELLDTKSGAVFLYGEEFGMGDLEPNLNANSKDSDGNIWLGSQNGIIKYDPSIGTMPKWPLTRIEEMQVFLKKVDDETKSFSYDQNHISFRYQGFWYQNPGAVSYRTKLEGYDHEWINSKNSFVTYPNLPPGTYTFMVQSSVTGQFNGVDTEHYAFVISPPFYQTIWFYILTVIFIGSIVFLVVGQRERSLRTKQRVEKEKIEFQFETLKNQVNPHFLFNSFNTLIAIIEEDKEIAVDYVIKLSDFYRDILLYRERDIIPLSKELEMIDNYFFLQSKRFKDNLRLVKNIPSNIQELGIPPLTLQLLVENAIKHNVISKDRPLTVEMEWEKNYLVVRNNLQKKVLHEESTGVGLANIRGRLQLLTPLQLRIEETSTSFSVYVPLIEI